MKLIIAILRDADTEPVTKALTAANYRVTRTSSTGGLLRRGVSTLLIGVENDRVDSAIELMRGNCTPPADDGKKLTIFVVPVEKFEQL